MSFEYLHTEVKKAAQAIRQEFDEANIGHLTFEIEVSGRTHDELKIKYGVGEYGCTVSGGDLRAVLIEYKRRKGWTEANEPLALPAGETVYEEGAD